jgi:hypothetical protein
MPSDLHENSYSEHFVADDNDVADDDDEDIVSDATKEIKRMRFSH